jgi:hypothetical protein
MIAFKNGIKTGKSTIYSHFFKLKKVSQPSIKSSPIFNMISNFSSRIEYLPCSIVLPSCTIAATLPLNSLLPKFFKSFNNSNLIPIFDGDIVSESREESLTLQRLKVILNHYLGMYKDQIYFLGAV